jgi:hypothetical protein
MTAEPHSGACQCGAVAFEALVDISNPATCNCSRCQRIGSILAFTPRENFTLLRGAEALTEYTFNRQIIRHQFCKVCGVQTFSFGLTRDGSEVVAINCNCLDGVDPRALTTRQVDGRAF